MLTVFFSDDAGVYKSCANCGIESTPLWRKDRPTGLVMCNACGIYYKNHGRHRPVELIEHTGPPQTPSTAVRTMSLPALPTKRLSGGPHDFFPEAGAGNGHIPSSAAADAARWVWPWLRLHVEAAQMEAVAFSWCDINHKASQGINGIAIV